jgi:glycosyltransferase involved in cell wall biosynthesis
MNEQARRRVLMLAYFFPPLGGGGVQRTLKHVKYLPDEGFESIVLTTRLGWSSMRDPTLGADLRPGTKVIRATEIPVQMAKWGLHGVLRRAGLSTDITSYIGWPDETSGWVPAAIWHAFGAVRRHRPDVLYSTSSPVSAHLVALIVSRATGIPWVADFRDPWMINPQVRRLAGPVRDLSERLERAIVRHARYVTIPDESVELLGIGDEDPRLVLIRNGVDPDDLPPTVSTGRNTKFRLAHVGSLYGERNAAPVFAALRSLLDRKAVDPRNVEIRIVGSAALGDDANLEGLPVTRTGYVDHAAAVSEMAAADALLLYAPPVIRGPSGKIYEYLVSGRPILCVTRADNFAFRLVRQLGAGICAEPGDQPGIEAAIEQLYVRWSHGELRVDPKVRDEALSRFSRAVLARQLASVLDAARVSRGASPS